MLYEKSSDRYPYNFLVLYALIYMCHAVYNIFMPIYLDHAGFGRTSIGTLMALGPFVAIIAQPIWGIASDRAKTKNDILMIMVLGSAAAIVLYPLSKNFCFLFFIIAVFTFFQTGIFPLSDAITLEYLETSRWKFGPIRMAGTIGFSIMAVVTGVLSRNSINIIFILYFAICVLVLISIFSIPKIKGHQSEGNKVSPLELFKNRELVILMIFNFSIQTTLGYYYSFFPIHYRSLGGDNALLGWTQFTAAMSEIPFLLFADRIVSRLGTRYTMMLSAITIAVRWLLFSSVTNIYAVLLINMLHGFGFIVLQYSMATYINLNVPRELKATGQTINGLIGLGASRIAGSVLGGFLSDAFGTGQTFLFDSVMAFTAVGVFGAIFAKERKHIEPVEVDGG